MDGRKITARRMSMDNDPVIHIIAGPTASGKSGLAIERALSANGVVINADSQQVYRALPLLSAQPSQSDLQAAPHALYAYLPPSVTYSAPMWGEAAVAEINQALENGKAPILVGGTGLYLKTLLTGMSPIPETNPETRVFAARMRDMIGPDAFHELLKSRDPAMADKLHPNDTQRVLRAWEVLEDTGRSLLEWQSLPPVLPRPEWRFEITLLLPEKSVLDRRADVRLEGMVEQGVLDEVASYAKDVMEGRVPVDTPPEKAIGYRPLRDALQGRISLDEGLERAKIETHQYAKRQKTWFRHQIKPQANISKITIIE